MHEACGGDEALRRELDSLLAYEVRTAAFLTGEALAVLARTESDASTGQMTGRQLGPYAIGALLGSGGMGDVYRATDLKLDREVAVKFLPDVFALDPERRARFEREARVLAALNHPHIGAIYGFEEREGLHALILELVEGETLAARLESSALPIGTALAAASQIAQALEAAHAKGIVHRDLKPANVVVRERGPADVDVKILDFGLAKSAGAERLGSAETSAGVILGTVPYMSPEQARGTAVDARTDVWALGCVLFEMLSRCRAFAGATPSDTLAAILHQEPDWTRLPAETPPPVVDLLKRALEKDAARRLSSAGEVRHVLSAEIASPERVVRTGPPVPVHKRRRRSIVLAVTAAMVLAAIAAVTSRLVRTPAPLSSPTRLSVFVPGILSPQLSATVSPDGRQLAFVSTGATGKLMLWIRTLDSLEARVVDGTENAAHPFWSPDGAAIGFLADGKLKKVSTAGGPVDTLADSPERSGATWNGSGTILFAGRIGEMNAISADGGAIATVIPRDRFGRTSRWPSFLPDGRHFVYFRSSALSEERGIYISSLDGQEPKLLLRTDLKASVAADHLLYLHDDALFAQRLDLVRLELTGKPVRIADGIWTAPGAAQASFSASRDGVLAYVNASLANLQLALFDRAGKLRGYVGAPGRYQGTPQLSPDGRRLAVAQGGPGGEHIWIADVADQTTSRLTFGPTRENGPVWSADGGQLAYLSTSGQVSSLVRKALRDGSEEKLLESDRLVSVDDWSPDGRYLVYTTFGTRSYSDLWLLPLFGERRLLPFLESTFNKTQAQVSPDGNWIAYTSYESGTDQIYVERFPTPGNRRQISVGGGVQPRWRKDGRELFYIAPDQRLIAVPINGGPDLRTGPPLALFKTRVLPHGSQSVGLRTLYDASPDGQQFVCLVPPEDPGAPITVVLNWTAALQPGRVTPQ